MIKNLLLILLISAFLLTACGGEATPDPALDPVIAMTAAFATVNAAFTQTALALPTSSIPTETPVPTAGPQPTAFSPTVVLPATVKATSNCRFGPGTVYAGPGGVRTGKVLEAIGRDTTSEWIMVREVGGNKSCWVNIIGLTIQGDGNTLAIAPVALVFTENYPPPPNITAVRSGDQVQISWGDVPLQPQVVFPESHYFLELWLCSGGQLTPSILATNDLTLTVTDQPGCTGASHGLLYTTTREGYSQPAVIPWP